MVNLGNQGVQTVIRLLLISLEQSLDINLLEDLLDDQDIGLLATTIVLIQQLTLLRRGLGQSLVDQPRALVVLDIRTDLADRRGVTVAVQVIILDLEVLAQGQENGLGLLERGLVLDTGHVHRQRHGEVERVVGGLVDDNERVLLDRELGQIHIVLGGGDQIQELTQLGLVGRLVEELDQVDVVGVLLEVLLQEEVDRGLEDESIVNGNVTDALLQNEE